MKINGKIKFNKNQLINYLIQYEPLPLKMAKNISWYKSLKLQAIFFASVTIGVFLLFFLSGDLFHIWVNKKNSV